MKIYTNNTTFNYNSFLLSKYKLLSIPGSNLGLSINLDLKYRFKNLDETLLVFWLFYILTGRKVPIVSFSKFNKKLCIMSFKNVSLETIVCLLEDFLYNSRYKTKSKKKIKFVSAIKLLCYYIKNPKTYFFCNFISVFKQNNLEYIFYDLGVSGVKFQFKLSLEPLISKSLVKYNLYEDLLQLSDFEYIIKNYMFEDISGV